MARLEQPDVAPPAGADLSPGVAAGGSVTATGESGATAAAVLEALELPLNGPRRFWLGFAFVEDRRLAAHARDLADEVVRGRGRELETLVATDAEAVESIARALLEHAGTESPLWVDWSRIGSSPHDRAAVEHGLAMLNTGRARLSKQLRGGLVIAAPAWAEAALAQGAVDLWSGAEFALRLRSDVSATDAPAVAVAAPPTDPRLWRRLAPIAVLRALRDDGPQAAADVVAEYAANAGPGDAARFDAVAAGVALQRGDHDMAATRALAAIEAGATPDVAMAAIEIAVVGARGRALDPELWREADALLATVGDEDRDVLGGLDELAATLDAQGHYARAGTVLERAFAARRRVLGAEHPATLRTGNNLAGAYRAAGRTADAIAIYEPLLADTERVLGTEHPDTLRTRNNLAGAYQAAGRTADSIAIFEPLLADRERVLGAEHPDTLGTRNNLANAYWATGRTADSIAIFEPLLADSERVLGAEHPATLGIRNNLASTYRAAGRTADAIAIYEPLLADRERVLGIEHPDTLGTRNNLANAYQAAGRTADAIAIFEPLLADRERVLGAEHPDTLRTRNNLANAYRADGRGADALRLDPSRQPPQRLAQGPTPEEA